MTECGLEVPQLREGEGSLSTLYVKIRQEKARRENRKIDPAEIEIPDKLDFRMDHRSTPGKFGDRYPK